VFNKVLLGALLHFAACLECAMSGKRWWAVHAVGMLKALIDAYAIRKNALCSWGFKLPQEQL
jgi:hypothetical protein